MCMPRFFCLLLGLLFTASHLVGQSQATASPNTPLAGKRVGLYLSLKALQFDSYYYKPLAAWLQRSDSLNLQYEDIRLAVAVKLGNYLTQLLMEEMGADTAFFLNADPALGGPFLKHYRNSQLNSTALYPSLPAGTDYLLVIDELNLGGRKEDVVFSFSNRLITEKTYVHEARVQLAGFGLGPSGALVSSPKVTHDFDGAHPVGQYRFYTSTEKALPAQRILDRVLNAALNALFP